jgi:hypothetical protein
VCIEIVCTYCNSSVIVCTQSISVQPRGYGLELTKCDEILSLTVTYDSLVKFHGGIWGGISTPTSSNYFIQIHLAVFALLRFLISKMRDPGPLYPVINGLQNACYMYICHIVYTWQEAMIIVKLWKWLICPYRYRKESYIISIVREQERALLLALIIVTKRMYHDLFPCAS